MRISDDCLLYGILDLSYVAPANAPAMASSLLHGGVGILQLRAKGHSPDQIARLAPAIQTICADFRVPFILNDHVELAASLGADGAHVGQDDMSVGEARSILGLGKIVGLSTHSVAQARSAFAAAPDYIGFGPLFATPTKPDYVPIGTNEIGTVMSEAPVPVFCIGGIKPGNLSEVLASGAQRVVIVSGLLNATDPESTSRACAEILRQNLKKEPAEGLR